MQLRSNMLLAWQDSKGTESNSPLIERVLAFDMLTDEVIVIDVCDQHTFPRLRSGRFIEDEYQAGALTIVENDPFTHIMIAEDKIKPSHRRHRDAAWEEMAPLLENEDPEFMLYAWKRGPLVKAHRQKIKRRNKRGTLVTLSFETVYKRLRLWWQSGRKKNAFLPNFGRCGAPGHCRLADFSEITDHQPKLGRRSALAISSGRMQSGIGLRMTAAIYRKFELGVKRFYNQPEQRTLKKAFELTIQKYFAVGYEIVDGTPVPIIPSEDSRPTFDQFA
jgi:hypothetical protein